MQRTGLSCALALGLFGLLALPAGDATAASSETYRQLNLFGDVFEQVRSDYVTEVEDEQLIEDAINGMLAGLDPHSSYLNPRNFQDMQIQTRGEFGGLGIEVTMEEGVVKVVAPMDDTPADRAGVEAGDYITHLDGEPILGLTLSEAVDRMRGRPGTDLTITVVRDGEREPFDVTITRDLIELKAVRFRTEENVGYIRITTFNEHTEENTRAAIRDLQREVGPGLEGFVIDLRNNPGGLLNQAIEVSDLFLNEGEIVSTRGRHTEDTQRFNARRGDLSNGLPVIVLINGGSASASEIVAGALQDQRRAIVLGTQSFGKGSVQTVIPLNGGANGALRLTTAKYYTPSGRSIQARGIEPDIEVAYRADGADARRRRSEADLTGHLPAEGEDAQDEDVSATPDPEAQPEPETPATPDETPATPDDSADEAPEAEAEDEDLDRQLERALQILRGITLNSQRASDLRASR